MRKKRTLLAGLVTVLILGCMYFAVDFLMDFIEKREIEERQSMAESRVVLSLTSDEIKNISFEGQQGAASFKQTDAGWISPDDEHFVMSEDKADRLCGDLAALTAERAIRGSDLAKFGLDPPGITITIESTDGKTVLCVGNRNDSNHELYFKAEGEDAVYLTKTALDEHFSGELKDFAAYEEFPSFTPRLIRSIIVDKEEGFTLITPGDDSCTVLGDDGTEEKADLNKVGTVQDLLSHISWLDDLEYYCVSPEEYGLADPRCVIRITSEGEDEETVLKIGGEDEKGNYYVQPEGSMQVHSVRREYLEELVESESGDFWSHTYSFVSIGDLDHLDVTAAGETHTLKRVSNGGLQKDEYLSWYVDETEVSKKAFTDFYYACVSVTAQERYKEILESPGEPVLVLHYYLLDGTEKTIKYHELDQNFYLVLYEDDTKAAAANRIYVKTMLESLDVLLKEAEDKGRQ